MFASARAPGVSTAAAGRVRRRRWLLVILTTAAVVLGLTELATGATADPARAGAGEFVPVTAASLVQTTSGTGWAGKLQPNATKSVTATGALGVPATGVLAVMLHISTSGSGGAGVNRNGNLWAWPAGAARPRYAIVANAPTGSVADNTAIVKVGTAGRISFYNGPTGTAVNVNADIEGYVTASGTAAAGATFAPLTTSRIIDTSNGTGGRSAPLTSAAPWTFHTLSVGGIPDSGVAAVALNVGAHSTSTNCWVQIQPAGTPTDDSSYPRVDTYANYTAQELAVVAPDTNGDVTFSTNCASTDVFADVEGYYLTPDNGSTGDVYVPIANPTRIIDTRTNHGITGKLTAGRVLTGSSAVAVRGVGGVPAGADAVALSIGTVNAHERGYNTIWTDGAAQSTETSTVDVEPNVVESNLIFVATGPTGKIDVADPSAIPSESNDLYVDIEGYFTRVAPPSTAFGTPQYYSNVIGDTYFNTTGTDGQIVATSDDARAVNNACATSGGGDVVILHGSGSDPANLTLTTVNCMTSYGPVGGGKDSPDRCSWKSAGITRVGQTIYLAVARQLRQCSAGKEANGLQPSFNATIVKSTDGGKTWRNPWSTPSANGAAPPYISSRKAFESMFPGQSFSAPFFIQYGPGNTQTVDGADKYLYAVSNDGYAYNGNWLHLGRVPLNKVQSAKAWQFYHGKVGGYGKVWTSSPVGATRVLQANKELSQPAIQYVPSLRRYVLVTFSYSQALSDFPMPTETPYTQFRMYTSPKPWGPWTKVFDHTAQRSLWCTSSPCQLTEQPQTTSLSVGTPNDWLGYYDPTLVQKFVFTNPLADQALFTSGDFKNPTRYTGEQLYRLHAIPVDLSSLLR